MARSSRKFEDAKDWLHRLSKTELQALKAQVDSRLHELTEREAGCRLLKLPPELRNIIYRMIAVDYACTAFNINTPNVNANIPHYERRQKFREPSSLALTNKQISGEYLSVLNSEEAASAQIYDQQAAPDKWIDIDIRKLLGTVRSIPRRTYRRSGMEHSSQPDVFLPGRIFRLCCGGERGAC
ncbi:hypothetical protein Slin15195_G037420 [Septoria linicola]|uniref:F-box domain-containing protein n=1 Tax=Septoria linicola TaxID=215465 RepID=A0A9Q9ANW0_9PEZI|nr:hypothetical protein Slin14017_G118830 [Septoria linicola]USW50423.1 hypothetical protein Slin15195_G037420 [Septoria linicola]